MRAFRILVLIAFLCCLVPVVSLVLATYAARWAGCELDSDVPLPCRVLGGDYGEPLFAVWQFGLFSVVTLPLIAALLASWLVVEAANLLGRKSQQAGGQTPATSRNRTRGS